MMGTGSREYMRWEATAGMGDGGQWMSFCHHDGLGHVKGKWSFLCTKGHSQLFVCGLEGAVMGENEGDAILSSQGE